jgi:Cdc6-like AAA superfamily ATPase
MVIMPFEGNLITNPDIFLASNTPDKILHRDKERSSLLSSMKALANIMITGRYGSGKSTIMKAAIREYNELHEGKAVYIDCAIYQTTYSILKEVLPKGELVIYRSNYELIRELKKYAKSSKFVIALDNFDQLKDKNLIARFMSLGMCVFLVTDNEQNATVLNTNIRSNVSSTLAITKYETEQAVAILRTYAEKGLNRWCYSDDVLRAIAVKVDGNITLGLNVLKAAVLKAQNEGKRSIEPADIVFEEDCVGTDVTLDQRLILDIMREWRSLPSSQLYRSYLEKVTHPKSDRAFRNYVHELCVKGMLKAVGEKKGRVYEYIVVEPKLETVVGEASKPKSNGGSD